MSSGDGPPQWRRRTVVVPGVISATLGTVLGTLGFFAASFGIGTICTDFNEAQGACNALYAWLFAGVIGQWGLVLVTGFLLGIGLRRPESRRRMAAAAWVAVVITIAWYCTYYYAGYHSFRNH